MQNTLQLLTPAGQLALIVGDEDEDGKGANAHFYFPRGMTVDTAGHIVVACGNNLPRVVQREGRRSTLGPRWVNRGSPIFGGHPWVPSEN
jgi:hypothetical protein